MSYWKFIDTTYLYDGTFYGLLTIVFDCYVSGTIPICIFPEKQYVANLFDKPVCIKTDSVKAQRILDGIVKNISSEALHQTYGAFLANSSQKELAIVQYLFHGFKIGPSILHMLSCDYVLLVQQLRKKSFGECHRLKGLLRFMEIGNNVFFAKIHPDHAILEPLGQHFMRRLPNQNFMIQDLNRNLCFLYNTKTYTIEEVALAAIPSLSEKELLYQTLWKRYFETISIKERINPRCQMQYMPKKYWKDLIEI